MAVAPESIPRLDEVGSIWRVAAFASLATTLVGLLFGWSRRFSATGRS